MSEEKEEERELFSDRPLMTMRVSHDSGRTWKTERAVFGTDDLRPLITAEWPPCRCRHCVKPHKSAHR
jgi:hypothetical protein